MSFVTESHHRLLLMVAGVNEVRQIRAVIVGTAAYDFFKTAHH
ncbi:hypothetical protein [Shouchella shacheensis]|nr:hypothetical protein [Shouchella shacheensis]